MRKSFAFVVLLMGVLIGENLTSASHYPTSASRSSPAINRPPPTPTFICVVVGDAACNRLCKIISHIYGTPLNPARCDPTNKCECSERQYLSLEDRWNEKFSPAEFLKDIKPGPLYGRILGVLKTPYRTREQTKSDLQQYLSPSQFAQVNVKDNVAENIIKENADGGKKFDRDNIRAYVHKSLQSEPLELPEDFDYKTRFYHILTETYSYDTIDKVVHDIRRFKSPALIKLVEDYLKEKDKQSPTYQYDFNDSDNGKPLKDILDSVMVEEIISK